MVRACKNIVKPGAITIRHATLSIQKDIDAWAMYLNPIVLGMPDMKALKHRFPPKLSQHFRPEVPSPAL
jgi:hypothetical protein